MFPFKVLIICTQFFGIVTSELLLNFTSANSRCQGHGGLLEVNSLRSSSLLSGTGIIENAHELESYRSLKENVSVWASELATSGPYISLYTCMSLDKHTFAENVTFLNNVIYECSVKCAQKLNNNGYMGVTGNTCICISDSYTSFPDNPECEENDFLDINKGITVFKFQQSILNTLSDWPDFNCVSASIEKGSPKYHNTKCFSEMSGICSNRIDSSLRSECVPKLNGGGFCFLEKNATFLEHTKTCLKHGGVLLSVTSRVTEFRNSVMVGSFRALKAIEDDVKNKDTNSWSCLSITKFHGIVYLETERCSKEHALICMDAIKQDKSGCVSKDGFKRYILIISSMVPFLVAILT